MVRNDIQVSFTQHQRTRCPEENLVQGIIEAVLRHCNLIATCCQQSSFVDEIGNVRANHPGGGTRNGNQVHVFRQWDAERVNLENGQATIPVRALYRHLPIEATWAQESLVQPIWAVGWWSGRSGGGRFKGIEGGEQLVEGVLAGGGAIDAGAALAT